MLTIPEHIREWNTVSVELMAELLTHVFKRLQTPEEVAVHNFIMFQIDARLQDKGELFRAKVAEQIKLLSLRNLKNGQKDENSNPRRTPSPRR